MGEGARRARLADLTESIIGALYLDLGLETTQAWLHAALSFKYEELEHNTDTLDPKTALQHWTHRHYQETPTYSTRSTSTASSRDVDCVSPPPLRRYIAEVSLAAEIIGRGEAESKKEAQFEAARNALKALTAQPVKPS